MPVRYFHWVFTLPAALRPLLLQNQAPLYRLLFESASATLLQFGQQRFQAELGLTAILPTWGQNLMNHPHLHCLVTGGGLTAQNTWAGPKQTRWLFPVHAVGKVFQGKFCAGLLQLHATGKLQFHGHCNRRKALTLTGVEFIRRLRLHLLPRGFTKIRHYGLLGNNRRHRCVPQARTALATSPLRFAPRLAPRPAPPPLTCPHCQGTEVRCIGRVERSGQIRLFARPWLSGQAPAYTDTS